MVATKNLALIVLTVYSVFVQQLEFSVRPGTPQGYTPLLAGLLHTGAADVLCKECGAEINEQRAASGRMFCGFACYWKWMKHGNKGAANPSWKGKTIEKACIFCGGKFKSYIGWKKKYCSTKCSGNHRKVLCKDHPWRRGKILNCKTCGTPFHAQDRDVRLGKKKYCSVRCNPATIRKGQFAKEKHPMWRGEARAEDVRARESEDYKAWRAAVMRRDKFTCQDCGQHGGVLSAHHIRKFSKNHALRLFIPNGITLCWNCHKKVTGHEEEHEARLRSKVCLLV